jgi:tRNA(Ser,Leu) C12 N-acetylase TAN1
VFPSPGKGASSLDDILDAATKVAKRAAKNAALAVEARKKDHEERLTVAIITAGGEPG